jgi:hypothetical protein
MPSRHEKTAQVLEHLSRSSSQATEPQPEKSTTPSYRTWLETAIGKRQYQRQRSSGVSRYGGVLWTNRAEPWTWTILH